MSKSTRAFVEMMARFQSSPPDELDAAPLGLLPFAAERRRREELLTAFLLGACGALLAVLLLAYWTGDVDALVLAWTGR